MSAGRAPAVAGGVRAWAPAAAALAIGLALWLALRGHDGYDLDYALFWGGQLAHGHVPDFATPFAPTPHPLANLLGAIVTPLGAPGDAFRLVIEVSLGAMSVAAYRLGARLFGSWAGWLAAVVLLTRPALLASALRGSIDIPALALTLFALDALLGEERHWTRALVLLGFAGLLRPEAWLLSLAVVAWRRDPRSLPLALAAPVIWCASDLAITGDPLFSLHGTQALAENLDRPRSAPLAPLLVPRLITDVIGLPVMLAGAVGLVALSERPSREFRTMLAVVLLALATFVVIGAAGLPLLARYLLPPAALLAILGAATAAGGPRGFALAALACLLAAIPGTVSGLRDTVSDARMRRAVQADLRTMVHRPDYARAVRACPPLSAVTYREVPEIARAAGVAPATIRPVPTSGTILLPRSADAVTSLQSASDTSPLLLRPPAGYALGAQTRDWAIAQRCVRP